MKNKKTFSEKTRRIVNAAQYGYCSVDGCYEKICDFDHIVPNTKVNNTKYPLFLHSPINCQGLCRTHHIHKKKYGKEISYEWAQLYENFLQNIRDKNE